MMNKGKYPIAFIFVIGLIFISAATVQAECPADIISYWTLNEKIPGTYADTLNVNPGDGVSDPAPTDGIINGAQLFDGLANGIEVTASSDFDFAADGSFTFEMWMKRDGDLDDGVPGTEVMLGRSGTVNMQYWVGIRRVDVGGGVLNDVAVARLQSTSGEGATTISGTTDVTDGEWHQIVFVRNDTLGQNILYVDGEIEAQPAQDYVNGFDGADQPLTLGKLESTFNFGGALDEVAIYGRALPQAEIRQHFTDEANLCGETALVSVVSGDFNNDGREDLAGVSPSGEVYYSTTLGTWVKIPGVVQSIVVGDFNNDGNDDLAGINPAGVISKIFYTTDLVSWTPIPGLITSIVTGDFNNDGNDDIAGINPAGVSFKVFYTTNLSTWTGVPGLITSIATGDFNNDGNDDIAGINPAGVSFKVFYTTNLSTWTGVPGLITSIASGDFNGDGNDDIAGINPNGVISKIFYTTNLTTWTPIPGLITQIAVGDFDGDGNDDIAGINPAGVAFKVFYTTNLSTWTGVPTAPPGPGTLDMITTGDFDEDGNDDLAGVNSIEEAFYTIDLATWTYIP